MNSRHYLEERTSEQKEVAWKRLIDEAKPLPKMERDKCEQFLEDGINEALWLIKHVEVRGVFLTLREMGQSTEGMNIITRVCLWFGLEFKKI